MLFMTLLCFIDGMHAACQYAVYMHVCDANLTHLITRHIHTHFEQMDTFVIRQYVNEFISEVQQCICM